jgi:hypothetical protein
MSSTIWNDIVRSATQQHGELLSQFFVKNGIAESKLFQTENNSIVIHQRYLPRTDRTVTLLTRSPAMESNIIAEATKVILSYRNRMNIDYPHFQGVIYFVYNKEGDITMPIYIGISHRLGRNNNLNQNLIHLESREFFARWGDDIARHIGGLSNALFKNGFPMEKKYLRFADAIIEQRDQDIVEKLPLYFGIKAIPKKFVYDNYPITLDELETKLIKRFNPLVNTIFS